VAEEPHLHDPLDSDRDLGYHEDGRVAAGAEPGNLHTVPADQK